MLPGMHVARQQGGRRGLGRSRPHRPLAGLLALAFGLSGSLAVAACTEAPGPARELVVTTGNLGGVYDVYGRAIAEALTGEEIIATAENSDGSVQNVRRVLDGRADAGFSLADVAASAVEGAEPFSAPGGLCAVARLYDNYVQAVVLAGSGIEDLSALRGRTVAIGSPGSGTAVVAERVLAAVLLRPGTDVQVVNLDVAAAAAALADAEVDAMFWSGGLPTAPIGQLAAEHEVRLLDVGSVATTLVDAHGSVYRASTIPASVYGSPAEVPTVSVANYLVVRCEAADDDVRAVLDVLFGPVGVRDAHPEAERLNRRSAIATGTVPLHDAAVMWFRDQGR